MPLRLRVPLPAVTLSVPAHPGEPEIWYVPSSETRVLPTAGFGARLEKLTPVSGTAESLVRVIRTVVEEPGATDVGKPGLLLTPTVKLGFAAAQAVLPAPSRAMATPTRATCADRSTRPLNPDAKRLFHETMHSLPTTDANQPTGTPATAIVGRCQTGK